jgi:hypothetical protein
MNFSNIFSDAISEGFNEVGSWILEKTQELSEDSSENSKE